MTRNETHALLPALRADPALRWLLGGHLLSTLGGQFSQVGLPWLVLGLNGDPLAVGGVLAALALPRAALILLGGVLVDRLGARRVLMGAQAANALVLAMLALACLWSGLSLWGVTALALALGTATAFSTPAAASLVPQVIAPEQRRVANRAMVGLSQLALFVGPPLAGGLIAWLGAAGQASRPGLAWAFGLDALGFLASALSVWPLRALANTTAPEQAGPTPSRPALHQSLLEGFQAVRADRDLLTSFVYGALIALCASGPLQVALPLMAGNLSSQAGAGAYGLLLGAFGAGCVGGTLIAGWRPDWRAGTVGRTMLLIDSCIALLFLALSFLFQLRLLWPLAALLGLCGLLFGYLQNMVYHWTQQRVPPVLLGRTMSLFMLLMLGVAPLSMLGIGVLLRWCSPAAVFALSGLAVLGVVALAQWQGRMPRLAEQAQPLGDAA